MTASEAQRGPVLLCYDGSAPAGHAIERAGRVLGGGNAVVLTVWESLGSAILRHTPSERTELGREAKEISEDVVAELDAGTAKRAQATAGEGASLAAAAGFEARPIAPRALSRTAERDAATVWRAVLAAADEEDARVIVLGSRGRSGAKSILLGSVSYGVVHHSTRPVLVIPGHRGFESRHLP
jgi:nucleotide-binding universal stress UspA family protein